LFCVIVINVVNIILIGISLILHFIKTKHNGTCRTVGGTFKFSATFDIYNICFYWKVFNFFFIVSVQENLNLIAWNSHYLWVKKFYICDFFVMNRLDLTIINLFTLKFIFRLFYNYSDKKNHPNLSMKISAPNFLCGSCPPDCFRIWVWWARMSNQKNIVSI
jgi:hypothetical protein